MQDYEILILGSDRRPATHVELMEPSDDAAIQSAMRIAHGRAVEVWRDIACVYRSPPAGANSRGI